MQDAEGRAASYLNPVYSRSFPDPFVLKFGGEYFAYATGFAPDGDVFMTLRSSDLVDWTEIGGAMKPLDDSPPYYWAPEVTYSNGKFYLYYSVGNETLMEIRLAMSDRPDGGFVDSGAKLTNEEFAIDAHVFVDEDGSRYFFYATDFLEHTHIGTGTVVDRMTAWNALAGEARPVTRAKYDWQVYDPNRKEKGGVRWHTVEGPTVLKRKGLYYEMFSGGNWQNTTYGVSYAVTRELDGNDEWAQLSDGVNVLPILRTIPGVVEGPGHNSLVRGPNNRELYCVYHRWVGGERVLAIDRMDFAGDRIFVVGPTSTPQPGPLMPTVRERFLSSGQSDQVSMRGKWHFSDDGASSDPLSRCEISIQTSESFLFELTARFSVDTAASGPTGLILEGTSGNTTINFHPASGSLEVLNSGGLPFVASLPSGFVADADHLIRVECDDRRFRMAVDGISLLSWRDLEAPVARVVIFSEVGSVTVRSIELTIGFEELFEDRIPLNRRGWQIDGGSNDTVGSGEINFSKSPFSLKKGPPLRHLEFAVNFRIIDPSQRGDFGLTLTGEDGSAFQFLVDLKGSVLEIRAAANETAALPANLDLTQYHQLRIMKLRGRAFCYFDDVTIGEFPLGDAEVQASVSGRDAAVAIEMIRLTELR